MVQVTEMECLLALESLLLLHQGQFCSVLFRYRFTVQTLPSDEWRKLSLSLYASLTIFIYLLLWLMNCLLMSHLIALMASCFFGRAVLSRVGWWLPHLVQVLFCGAQLLSMKISDPCRISYCVHTVYTRVFPLTVACCFSLFQIAELLRLPF